VDNLALRLAFGGTVCVWKQRSWLNSMSHTMDGTVGGEILCDLTSVDNDGTLHWAFRNKGVDVPRGGAHAVRVGKHLRVHGSGRDSTRWKGIRDRIRILDRRTESGAIVRDLRGDVASLH
jgi:hypothetical protein